MGVHGKKKSRPRVYNTLLDAIKNQTGILEDDTEEETTDEDF